MRKHHSHVTAAEWPYANFSPEEVACKRTGDVLLTPESRNALAKLQQLRQSLGHPLIILSGYRSPEHNRTIKGAAKNSKHMEGIAFDISVANVDPEVLIKAAKAVGFTSFGTYPRDGFVHIDTRKVPARWGEPFPKRDSRFDAEPPRPTVIRDAVETLPTPIAGAGAVEVALRELAPHVAADWQGYVMGAAVLIGLGVMLYRILRRGRHPDA